MCSRSLSRSLLGSVKWFYINLCVSESNIKYPQDWDPEIALGKMCCAPHNEYRNKNTYSCSDHKSLQLKSSSPQLQYFQGRVSGIPPPQHRMLSLGGSFPACAYTELIYFQDFLIRALGVVGERPLFEIQARKHCCAHSTVGNSFILSAFKTRVCQSSL